MYNYKAEKPKIFTEENQLKFIEVRDKCMKLLNEAAILWAGCRNFQIILLKSENSNGR